MTTDNKIVQIPNYNENNEKGEKYNKWDSLILLNILGVVILIAVIYFFTNNSSSNNNPYSSTDKLVFEYQKSKFTNELAFKSIALAKADIYSDRIEITIYPYIAYSGIYTIVNSQRVKSGVLNTVIKNDNVNAIPNYFQKTYYIHTSEIGNIMKIFDENRIGIILKQ